MHRALDRATSAALLGALRARALSLPHAVGAALALATFARNAPLAPGAHVTLDFNLCAPSPPPYSYTDSPPAST